MRRLTTLCLLALLGILAALPAARADECFHAEVSYGRASIHVCVDQSRDGIADQGVSGVGAVVVRRMAMSPAGGDPSATMSIAFEIGADKSLLPLRIRTRYQRQTHLAEFQICEWDDGYGWSRSPPQCLVRRLGDLDNECWHYCADWRSYAPGNG